MDYHRSVKMLLIHISRGQHDKAEALIEKEPSLLLGRRGVVMPDGTKLADISPPELAMSMADVKMAGIIDPLFHQAAGDNPIHQSAARDFSENLIQLMSQQAPNFRS